MAVARPLLSLLGMLFTAGATVMMFLTLLGGANNHGPLNAIYFLQVDTSNITGASHTSRWTFWNICGVGLSGRSHCGPSHPAYPLDPPSPSNFNTTTNIPPQFIGTNHYFLMTRFMFPFIIIALFFAICSFSMGLLALCTRIGSYVSCFLAWIAWVFQVITTCLMTAAYVQGRNAFNSNNQPARLGVLAFGLMWAAVACLTLSIFFYCTGGVASRRDTGYNGKAVKHRGFFGFKRPSSTRSRGSFANGRKEFV